MSANKQLLLGKGESGTYEPNAVKFDGANDYLTRGADLTSIADSKSGIVSFWIRIDDPQVATEMAVLENLVSVSGFQILKLTSNLLRVVGKNAATTTILNITNTAALTGAKWHHFLASWDLATTTTHVYLNDVSDKTSNTVTNDTIDYATATPNWAVGSRTDATLKFNGALAELYFAPGQYLDFSTESNRRKFIDADGLPVSLGADGSTPTGTAPAIYLKGDETGFGTNSGTGGNFTVNGALEAASTTPATAAVNAVDFDGSADYLSKATTATPTAGKTGIASFWCRIDGDVSAQKHIYYSSKLRLTISTDTTNRLEVWGAPSANYTAFLKLICSIDTTASPQWVHFLASWDTANNLGHLYLNGVSAKDAGSIHTGASNIDYPSMLANPGVGGTGAGATLWPGAISELYFAPNQYLDLSSQANREKFILDGAPVDLGADGSLPTGTAPAIYLPNRAALVGTNAGSGGNFTINGAPKDANSTPVYYYAEPVKFDGSADYLTRGSGLTGAADSATGIFSTWVRFDGGNGVGQSLLQGNSGFFHIFKTTLNYIQFDFYDASIVLKLRMYTSAILASAKWVHILASWTTGGATHLYVDNVSNKTVLTNVSGNIDYTVSDVGVGAQIGGTQKTDGCLADFYFAPGQYLDISNSANRAKFIDQTTLRPVPLGAKGELPTGSQPLLYLGRDYANFQTNLGSGGNFTVTGALERGTTSPSDVRA